MLIMIGNENGDLDLEDLWCPEENKPTKTHRLSFSGSVINSNITSLHLQCTTKCKNSISFQNTKFGSSARSRVQKKSSQKKKSSTRPIPPVDLDPR